MKTWTMSRRKCLRKVVMLSVWRLYFSRSNGSLTLRRHENGTPIRWRAGIHDVRCVESNSDIHSANILRSIRNHRWKLADFNTSRQIGQVYDYGFGLTKILAPECHGRYEQKYSSDAYSIGVKMLEAAANFNFGPSPPSNLRIVHILEDLAKDADFNQLVLTWQHGMLWIDRGFRSCLWIRFCDKPQTMQRHDHRC